MGYEIDRGWWDSKYSPPKFFKEMELIDPDTPVNTLSSLQEPDYALLACYFNNICAFEEYLKHFSGNCIILIGPDEGNGENYCDPLPFYLKDRDGWTIHSICKNSYKDVVVVYIRAS